MYILIPFVLACGGDKDDTGSLGTAPAPYEAEPGIALREDGWLRGDLHMHTTHSDGWDDLSTVIDLAEYLVDDLFLAAHPEYTDNQLDFISITDHRTVDGQSDPAYQSDMLILIGGEEFGSTGHAGVHGIHEFVDHDPDGDGVSVEDYQAAIEFTHEIGGTFSPNHPMLPRLQFPWAVDGFDGVEIWNAGWGLMVEANTMENVEEWESQYGASSATFRRAVVEAGNASEQALAWYEALLARGHHTAVIGGSDRHAVFLPGFPTTWVFSDGMDEAGVMQGIEARHTFVARTPVSAQVLLTVDVDGESYQMGDAIPIQGETEVIISVQVGRGDGGKVRLVGGGYVATDEDLDDAELGEILVESDIEGDDFVLEVIRTVSPGDWLYPMVLEPLIRPDADDIRASEVRVFAEAVVATGAEDFLGIANMTADYADSEVLVNSAECDPAQWNPDLLQCFPVDPDGFASMFVPDYLDRALNVIAVDGEITDWTMGAIGSAVVFE